MIEELNATPSVSGTNQDLSQCPCNLPVPVCPSSCAEQHRSPLRNEDPFSLWAVCSIWTFTPWRACLAFSHAPTQRHRHPVTGQWWRGTLFALTLTQDGSTGPAGIQRALWFGNGFIRTTLQLSVSLCPLLLPAQTFPYKYPTH